MSESTLPYYHWSSRSDWNNQPWETCQENLIQGYNYLVHKYGGSSLGCHFDRTVAGGRTMSTHSWGSALDWSYTQGSRFVGRQKAIDVVAPDLIAHSAEFGINTIHDYITQRMWKPLVGWRSASIGSLGGLWFHIETNLPQAHNSTPWVDRIRSQPLPPPQFLPEFGVWGLYPFNTAKPQIGPFASGDIVRYLHGVLHFKAQQPIRWARWDIYDGATTIAVDNLQHLCQYKLPSRQLDIERITRVVGPATWDAVDRLAKGTFPK